MVFSASIITVFYLTIITLYSIFTLIFVLGSIRERKSKAVFIGSSIFIILLLAGVTGFVSEAGFQILLLTISTALFLSGFLFFLPIGSVKSIEIGEISERVDERDTIFAREEYFPGTDKYDRYYSTHPELREIDDKIRSLPELLQPGGRFYDPIRSKYIDSIFARIVDMTPQVDGPNMPDQIKATPDLCTRLIKDFIFGQGAHSVGIARLNPMYVYSHVGRGPEEWGSNIKNTHKYVIVYSLEMDYNKIEKAPRLPAVDESAVQYLHGANISIALARLIRELGYSARAHINGSNYQIILPAAAYDAGLGEIGRLGYLITPYLGPRVRLGAVTTDLPLVIDHPVTFGVQEFCQICLKCAINCPSGAITTGDKTEVRGVKKWQLNIEPCLRYWRIIGTDCGLCMKVCPYSHPGALIHNLVRMGIRNSPIARRLSVWGDELFYGKKLPGIK